MDTTQIAAEFNKLPKPSSMASLYILAQQAFENGFRGMTVNELVVYLSKNLPDELTRSEFIYEKFAPGSALPDPGREASLFLGAGTYTTPGSGPSLELTENFNVVGWDGEKWVKLVEVPVEVEVADDVSLNNPLAVSSKGVYAALSPIVSALNEAGILIIGSQLFNRSSFTWSGNSIINASGNTGSTAQNTSIVSAFIPLESRWKKIEIKADLSNVNTRIATYSTNVFSSMTQSLSHENAIAANTYVLDLSEIDRFIRFSCQTPFLDSFSVKLLEADNDPLNTDAFILNEQYGIDSVAYNEDGIIASANVIWQDGEPGILTYSDYDPQWMAYNGYSITYKNKTLVQPPATRDDNGSITHLPLKTIS